MVIPLVIYGMKALSKLQVWTTPVWLILMIGPVAYLINKEPNLVGQFAQFTGHDGFAPMDMAAIMLGAGVCLSLIMQIGEQIDYLLYASQNQRQQQTMVGSRHFRRAGLGGFRCAQTNHRCILRLLLA